jgi:hypothetical protein
MKTTKDNSIKSAPLEAQQFGPTEAAYAAGISVQRLVSWHDDSLIPEPRDLSGRGHRRVYTIELLAHLVALRVLTERGMSLREAAKLAPTVARSIAEMVIWTHSVLTDPATAPEDDPEIILAVINQGYYFGNTDYQLATFSKGVLDAPTGRPSWEGLLAGKSACDTEDLFAFLRTQGDGSPFVILPESLANVLWERAIEILDGRGTPKFRAKLQTYLASFRREKGKPRPRTKRAGCK